MKKTINYKILLIFIVMFLCQKPSHSQKVYDVVIVGGGIAGLAAAYDLNKLDVLILEKENYLGGQILTKDTLGITYDMGAVWEYKKSYIPDTLNYKPSKLIKEEAPIGIYYNGIIYYGRDPFDCIKKMNLAPADYSSIVNFKKNLIDADKLTPKAYKILNSFFKTFAPVELQECGSNVIQQDMCFKRRNVNHYENGNKELVEYYKNRVKAEIKLNASVTSVEYKNGYVQTAFIKNDTSYCVCSKYAIVATPSSVARNILIEKNNKFLKFLDSLKYKEGITVAMGLNKENLEFSYIVTVDFISDAVMHHKNNNKSILYCYYWGEKYPDLNSYTDKQLTNITINSIKKLNIKNFDEKNIIFTDIQRWKYMSPAMSKRLNDFSTNDSICNFYTNKIFMAGACDFCIKKKLYGMGQDFPFGGMGSAIVSGKEAAKRLLQVYNKENPTTKQKKH